MKLTKGHLEFISDIIAKQGASVDKNVLIADFRDAISEHNVGCYNLVQFERGCRAAPVTRIKGI